VLGVAQGFVEIGVIGPDRLTLDLPQLFGNCGGYFYNRLWLRRVMGARPGRYTDLY
jgi:pyruvate,water dikinase